MATKNQIETADKQIDDIDVLNVVLTNLATIFSGTSDVNIIIERDGVTVDLKKYYRTLKDAGLPTSLMKSNIESDVLNLIGADEVTINTIRKSIKDLVVQHEIDIAAI